MKRRLFNAIVALSLLLLAAECVVWQLSRSGLYTIGRQFGSRLFAADSLFGHLSFEVSTGWPPSQIPNRWEFSRTLNGTQLTGSTNDGNTFISTVTLTYIPPNKFSLLGFGWDERTFGIGTPNPPPALPTITISRLRKLQIPWWFVCLATASLPICWLLKKFTARQPTGHCQTCGYDLRATPDRCPECGAIPSKVRAIAH